MANDGQNINISGVQLTATQLKGLEARGYTETDLKKMTTIQLQQLLSGSGNVKNNNNAKTNGFGSLTGASKTQDISNRLSTGNVSNPHASSSLASSANVRALSAYSPEELEAAGMSPQNFKDFAGNTVVEAGQKADIAAETNMANSIDNAVSNLKSAKGADKQAALEVAENESKSASASIEKIDGQIKDYSSKSTELKSQNKTLEEAKKQNDAKRGGLPAEQQNAIDNYEVKAAEYADIQAGADRTKEAYEMEPDTITDKNGKSAVNPKKAELKEDYEKANQQMARLESEMNSLKAGMTDDSKEVANGLSSYYKHNAQLGSYKAMESGLKDFKSTMTNKKGSLDKIIAAVKSRKTDTE